MRLNRFVIGVRFSERMFRMPSISGLLADELLKLRNENNSIGSDYFSKVTNRRGNDSITDFLLGLANSSDTNELIVTAEQFILKKTSPDDTAAVNRQKAIQEFEVLWKAANEIVKFGAVRRIGFAGEYLIPFDDKQHQLIGILTKLNNKDDLTTRFKLDLENRSFPNTGLEPNAETDSFINIIRNIYLSNMDETPHDGFLNANIDVQEYYNPTKTNPLKQLRKHLELYNDNKTKFIDELKALGIA